MAEAITITIKNLPQIRSAFNRAPKKMVKELNDAIAKTIYAVKSNEVLEYKSLGIRVITRGLITSINRGQYQRNLYGEVGPNVQGSPGVPYAGYVHSGTRFMRARPYLAYAVRDTEKDINKFFTEAVDNVLSDIGKSI